MATLIGTAFIAATLGPHNANPGWGKREALTCSVEFLEQVLARAPCDHEASSCCIRCNAIFLAHTMKALLDAAGIEAEGAK